MKLDEIFEAHTARELPSSRDHPVDDPFHLPKSRIVPRKDESDIITGIRGLIAAAQYLPRLESKLTSQQRSQVGKLLAMLSVFPAGSRRETAATSGGNADERLYGYF